MTVDLLQDGIATLIAVGAMAVLVRRVADFIRPGGTPEVGCASCPSHKCAGGAAPSSPSSTPVPLHVRRKRPSGRHLL
jgi:hypothetical protein